MLPTPARNAWSTQQRLEAARRARSSAPEARQREGGVQRLRAQLLERVGLAIVRAERLARLVPPVERDARELAHVAQAHARGRPRARSSRWTCGSCGVPAGSTNTWPVILTWSARTPAARQLQHQPLGAPADLDRWCARARPPRTRRASGCLTTRGQSVQKPAMRAPQHERRAARARSSRPREAPAWATSGRGQRRSSTPSRRRPSRRRPAARPAAAPTPSSGARAAPRPTSSPRGTSSSSSSCTESSIRAREPVAPQPLVEPDHGDLHDVRGGALDGHVDGHPLPCRRAAFVLRSSSSGIQRRRPRSVST